VNGSKVHAMIAAAGYIRMSTDQQGDSPDRQRSDIGSAIYCGFALADQTPGSPIRSNTASWALSYLNHTASASQFNR
jgi:hypothetical protein